MILLFLPGCGRPEDSYLSRVQEAGVLYVGIDPSWPPFEYVDPASGQVAGLDVDLAHAIGRELGVEVAFVVSGWEGLYGALFSGQFDAILSALPYDEWRTEEALYSLSYFNAGPVLVVPGDESAFPTDWTPRDLDGRTVHVEYGSEADVQARRLRKKAPELQIVTHDTADEALEAASAAGNAELALADAVSARLYIRGGSGELPRRSSLRIAGEPLYDDLYVVAVHPRARSLQAAIDQALVKMRESGELEALLERWL